MKHSCFRIGWLWVFLGILFFLQSIEARAVETWLGAYLNGSKVGHTYQFYGPPSGLPQTGLELPPELPKGCSSYLFTRTDLQIDAYGSSHPYTYQLWAGLNENDTLQQFRFRLESSGAVTSVSGTVSGRSLNLVLGESADAQTKVIALSEPELFLAESLPIKMAAAISKGVTTESFLVLEPHQLAVETWRIVYEATEVLQMDGDSVVTYRLRQEAGGLSPVTWINDRGEVLKESARLSEQALLTSYRETKDSALDRFYIHPEVIDAISTTGDTPTDLLLATAVTSETKIPSPRMIRQMTVKLHGFEAVNPLSISTPYQTRLDSNTPPFTAEAPLILRIQTPPWPLPEEQELAPVEPDHPFLQPESFVESEHSDIIALASEITEGLESRWDKSLAIYRWMADNIHTEFRVTLPSALEVLRSRRGDCNEQAALFTALARAAGVPARICTGLVYQQDAFFYHAWVEVLTGATESSWRPLDPAMHQTLVDATHIKLGEGGISTQGYINRLVGRISVELISLSTHSLTP